MKGKWVLVVEDDDDNRDVVLELLHEAGYEARGAAGAAEALTILHAERPCLVLADMLMNEMDGRALLVETRRLFERAAPPFVFLTGLPSSELTDISGTILIKPIDIERLLGIVAQHCGG